ncbi:MAG TPA: hypothetical protein VNU46_01285, partial [Gemmatimonadaceae bacterium]|nr:hypothetical protein [Gemmatimonadaceae bacterium]
MANTQSTPTVTSRSTTSHHMSDNMGNGTALAPSRVFMTRRVPDIAFSIFKDAGVTVTVGQTDEEQGIAKEIVIAKVKDADVLYSLLTEPV